MDSSFHGQEILTSVFDSSVRTREEEIRAHFTPARQWLQSVLELSRSQSAVLQGENSLARHFHVPFTSDLIAERVGRLFGELRILKDENGELDKDIWVTDILLEPTYEPTPQEDGSYHLHLKRRKGLIKMSKSDHDLIMTGIPQQLVNPCLYASDVLAEEETMKLVKEELSVLNEMALQIIGTNNDVLSRLAERLAALKRLRDQSCHSQKSQPTTDLSVRTDSHTSTGPPDRTAQEALPTIRPWKPEELDRIPRWFREHKNLPKEKVLAQFQRDFGHHRSFAAMQAASYRARRTGYRNPRKRRRTIPEDDPSPQPIAIEPAPEPSNIRPGSLTFKSVPRACISLLGALTSFPSPDIPSSEDGPPHIPSVESFQTAHGEAQIPTNTTEPSSWNEHSSSSSSISETRSSGKSGTVVPCSAVVGGARANLSLENGRQSTQLGPAAAQDGNVPSDINQGSSELSTPASFRPINLRHQPGSDAVGVGAQGSIAVATTPAMNSHKQDAQNKTDGSPADHVTTADKGYMSFGIAGENSVPSLQIVTEAQPNSGEAPRNPPKVPREQRPSSPSQCEHQCLPALLSGIEPRIVAGASDRPLDAFEHFRQPTYNSNHNQGLSQWSSHRSAAQQTDGSDVRFVEVQQLDLQSDEHRKVARSRSGCTTCRTIKINCDENHPACDNCVRSGLQCDSPRKPRKPRKTGPKPFAQQQKEGSSALHGGNQENLRSVLTRHWLKQV